MKVAIAGTGNVAQYLIEEFTAYGHEVVVLTRRQKTNVTYEQRETDYSIPSLIKVLEDRDALVSTIADYSNPTAGVQVHLDMLEAVKQSKRCKTYIPSEWTLNVEDHPDQPMFFAENNATIHGALKASSGVRWTIISNAWFGDYVVPSGNRHLRDVGSLFPINHDKKEFTVYGPGTQLVDFTPARDVARAVAALIDSKIPWEPYTYISGQQTTWNGLFEIMKKRDPAWTSRTKPLGETIRQLTANKSLESAIEAYFELEGYAGALHFPRERIQRHREKYFSNVHFRTLDELLDQVAKDPKTIV